MQEGLTPKGEIVTGFKATDENMCCRGFQYEIGKWYEQRPEKLPPGTPDPRD